jgi:hypothetical protein
MQCRYTSHCRWEGVPVGSSLSLDLGCTNAQVEMQTGGHEEVAFGVEIPTHMPACDTPFILSAVEHDQRLAIGMKIFQHISCNVVFPHSKSLGHTQTRLSL